MDTRHPNESGVPAKHPHENTCTTVAKVASKIFLGAVGLGAGALYYNPAHVCAVNPTCGLWASEIISVPGATVVFISGGVAFAGINGYFSSKSIERFADYINKQKTLPRKVGMGSLVIFLTASQTLSVLLTTKSTSNHPVEAAITILGMIPGVFFGSVNLMDMNIPWVISKTVNSLRNPYYFTSSRLFKLKESQHLHRAKVLHFMREYQHFLSTAKSHWRFITSHPNQINIDASQTSHTALLKTLMQIPAEADAHPYVTAIVHRFAELLGLAISANHSAAFIVNSYNGFNQYNLKPLLQGVISSALSLSSTLSNTSVTIRGTTGLLDNLANLFLGRPINSLMFHLYPLRSFFALIACTLISVLSYAVENLLFEREFPGEDVGKRHAFRVSANIGMDFYHLVGLFHFYHLMTALLTRRERHRIFFQLETVAEEINDMTYEGFMQLVEDLSPAEQVEVGIQPYNAPTNHDHAIPAGETIVIEDEQSNAAQDQGVPKAVRRGWCARLFSCCGKKANEEEAQSLLINNDEVSVNGLEEKSRFIY